MESGPGGAGRAGGGGTDRRAHGRTDGRAVSKVEDGLFSLSAPTRARRSTGWPSRRG
ncbi:MAG: hypothetical protein MZU91_06405 [Desulfosudis oleivorans]|nr:hypothetical protein [Desulfosudis oleivorans]